MSEQFSMEFRRYDTAGLRVHVVGDTTLENTMAYWTAIVHQVALRRPEQLLLVDEMGGRPLSADEWRQLVQSVAGRGLEGIRIAHVKPRGLEKIEYCEIYANEAGLQARVFDDEHVADRWLRYGEMQDPQA